jgi:hypothetical protein
VLDVVIFYSALAMGAGVLLFIGHHHGRHHQVMRDRREWRQVLTTVQEIKTAMPNFNELATQIDRLIAALQAPRPEDPQVQADIDALAAKAKAAADAATPPA